MNEIEPIEILLGRGPTCYNNIGNQRFREVMKLYLSDYAESVSKSRKHTSILIENLLSKLRIQGFRFRFRSKLTGEWVDAPECMAKEKVAHSLRDYSKRIPGVCNKGKQTNSCVSGDDKGLNLPKGKEPTKQQDHTMCDTDADKMIIKWHQVNVETLMESYSHALSGSFDTTPTPNLAYDFSKFHGTFNSECGMSIGNYFVEKSNSHELEGTSLTSLLSNKFHLNDHDTGNNYCNCTEGYEDILNHNLQSLLEVTDFRISEGKKMQFK